MKRIMHPAGVDASRIRGGLGQAAGPDTITSATYANLPTSTTSADVTVAGDVIVTIQGTLTGAAAGQSVTLAVKVGAAAADDANSVAVVGTTAGVVSRTIVLENQPVGTVLHPVAKASQTGATVAGVLLIAEPVRILA